MTDDIGRLQGETDHTTQMNFDSSQQLYTPEPTEEKVTITLGIVFSAS